MTFNEFQKMNQHRSDEIFHSKGDPWPIQNWALAIAGESGEMCNLIKKVLRGNFTLEEKRQEILKELADIICYCDLAMSNLNADTGQEVLKKFNEVSKRYNWVGSR